MSAAFTIETHLTADDRRQVLLDDARSGFAATPKQLSPIWFYDERGSALFDEITRLPEYYQTRAERSLLEAHAAEIAERTGADTLVELGSGTSEKTRVLLDALDGAGSLRRYVPFDVDPDTLAAAAGALRDAYPALDVHAVVGDFHRHLDRLPRDGCRLVAFLGGTIGNLEPGERSAFLRELRQGLAPGDHLLVGVDLVKDPSRLVAAYDDAAGVTAEFNRNALHVCNRELDADFDTSAFEHRAVWDATASWIEMRLRARTPQTVTVGALGVRLELEAGEELRTEISAKFTPAGFADELAEADLAVAGTWRAGEDDFLLALAAPA